LLNIVRYELKSENISNKANAFSISSRYTIFFQYPCKRSPWNHYTP